MMGARPVRAPYRRGVGLRSAEGGRVRLRAARLAGREDTSSPARPSADVFFLRACSTLGFWCSYLSASPLQPPATRVSSMRKSWGRRACRARLSAACTSCKLRQGLRAKSQVRYPVACSSHSGSGTWCWRDHCQTPHRPHMLQHRAGAALGSDVVD